MRMLVLAIYIAIYNDTGGVAVTYFEVEPEPYNIAIVCAIAI